MDRKDLKMSLSRGEINFQPLFTSGDIGVRTDAVVEHVVTEPGFGWHLRRAGYYAN